MTKNHDDDADNDSEWFYNDCPWMSMADDFSMVDYDSRGERLMVAISEQEY